MEKENTIGTPFYLISRDDLEAVIRKIIKEEIAKREAEKNAERLTTTQVIRRLHIDPSTLWRWRKTGRLKGVKIGKQITYKATDIAKLLGDDTIPIAKKEYRQNAKYPNEEKLCDVWWGDYNSFSVRCLNCLENNGIYTVGDLLSHSLGELMKLRNFGRKSRDELYDFLEYSGLKLK